MNDLPALLVELTHTSHSAARTVIQRLARSLFVELTALTPTCPVGFDPWQNAWRPLEGGELATARGAGATGAKRSARWTTGQKLRGWRRRWLGRAPALPTATGLIVPEIFSPVVAGRLPELFERVAGPKVAFFFDAIPLTHPEFTPARTVARFPAFMVELLRFDGVAAISQTTADHLTGYWHWLGEIDPPPVHVVPLGCVPPPATHAAPVGPLPRVLCVSTIEGRKNHLALLDAAEALWSAGLRFELRLVGLPRPETAASALQRIEQLQADGRPLHFDGVLDETALEAAWAGCAFSVYPSEIEGYGLPIVESLARGKPCICAATGAPGELVAGGGCLGVAPANSANLADALRRLLTDSALQVRLTTEARNRPLVTWRDSASDLLAWMGTLRRRA